MVRVQASTGSISSAVAGRRSRLAQRHTTRQRRPRSQLRRPQEQVEAAYQHKSYAYRGQRLEEFDRFIRRMSEGDLVLTPMQGMVYLGEVASPAYFEKSASVDNLRRDIRWFNAEDPIDGVSCTRPCRRCCRASLRGRSHRGLRPARCADFRGALKRRHRPFQYRKTAADAELEPRDRGTGREPSHGRRRAGEDQGPALGAQAGHLLRAAGTGKTYLATRLARHLTEDGAVKLVQFTRRTRTRTSSRGTGPPPAATAA